MSMLKFRSHMQKACGLFHISCLVYSEPLQISLVTVYTIIFDIQHLCILLAECICRFHIILKINSNYFLKYHLLIGLRNGEAVCFL